MSRLIDADKLIDFIDVGHLRHSGELCYSETEVTNQFMDGFDFLCEVSE